jgi:hypothetical protein
MKLTQIMLTCVFVSFSLTFFADEAIAQCVQCQARPTTFVCVGSSSGGNSCISDGALGCYLTGVCNPTNPGGPKPPHQPNQPRALQEGANACSSGQEDGQRLEGKVELDANTIKQISAVHPRFALALAMLSKNDALNSYAKVYLRAVNITPANVEEYLSRASNPAPLSLEEMRQLQATPVTPEAELVIYEVRPAQADDSTTGTIMLRVVQGAPGDAALDSLEVDLSQTQSGLNQKKWKATGWRVR